MSSGSALTDDDQQHWFGKRQRMIKFLPFSFRAPRQQRMWHCLLAMLLMPVLAQALPEDRQQPINISSDTADVDTRKGVSIYRGDVVVTQGTTRMTGDVVMVYTSNREISQVVAVGEGRLAYYEEQQPEDQGILRAWAETIRYSVDGDQIELIKNARLSRKGDVFTGEKIDYNLARQTVNARGAPDQGDSGRVQMVLQPRQKRNDSSTP